MDAGQEKPRRNQTDKDNHTRLIINWVGGLILAFFIIILLSIIAIIVSDVPDTDKVPILERLIGIYESFPKFALELIGFAEHHGWLSLAIAGIPVLLWIYSRSERLMANERFQRVKELQLKLDKWGNNCSNAKLTGKACI
ncbi:MAG: hypothetical protein ORN98_04470 [Alphaproteobacteria bacterium]|nr:hypothetical protein [Alphaproteobacteria bacterium]